MRVIDRGTVCESVGTSAGRQDQPAVEVGLDAWFDEGDDGAGVDHEKKELKPIRTEADCETARPRSNACGARMGGAPTGRGEPRSHSI
jgi:hypothetical protein